MAIETIIIMVICTIVTALNIMYLRTESFHRKLLIVTGIFLLWIVCVVSTAHYLYSYATTVEEGFMLWCVAFGTGCVAIAFEAFGLLIGNPKYKLTEKDKMKLKDI